MSPRVDALALAKARVASAQRALVEAMLQNFPPGSPVTFQRGRRLCEDGTVVQHAGGDRLRARNNTTGGVLTISALDIIKAERGGR